MTVMSTLDFDAIAESATVTVSAPWSTSGVAPTGVAGAAVHGARGARWASTDAYGRIGYDFGSNQSGPVVLSWYMQIRAFSGSSHYIASAHSLVSGGSLLGDVRINTVARTLSIRDGFTAVATSAATISLNRSYRCEWRINVSGTTQELRVYEGESSSPILTLSGAWTSNLNRVLTVGPNTAAAGGAIDYDTVRIADDWTGAFGAEVLVTAWRVRTLTGWEPVFAHSI